MARNKNIRQDENLELDKLEKVAGQPKMKDTHNHGKEDTGWKSHWDLLFALVLLMALLVLEYGFNLNIPDIPLLAVNLVAYFLAGRTVLHLAWRKSKRGDFFNEFVLMSVATIGAFIIGEYEEGVAVMVFYQIGEWFQDSAVNRAKRSIKALLDIRPDEVTVLRNGKAHVSNPAEVELGESIQVKPGEKVALDGELVSVTASFNTAALTGESKPDTKYKGEQVLAGMINLNTLAEVKVTALFRDSKLSKILEMVQDATARKSQTQLFISRFAKIYTPIVFFLALALCLLPYFFVTDYVFREWFYRSLVFLVISCPCALVVSIPLGYFGGIGLASRNGILFKGGNYLDVMTQVKTVVMDKTGTLTKGVFKVQHVVTQELEKDQLIKIAAALEKNSTHPIAKAVTDYANKDYESLHVTDIEEVAGHGLKGTVDGKDVLAGNLKLLKKYGVAYPEEAERVTDTIVVVAIDQKYSGYITIADEIKEDAYQAIREMHNLNIKTVMLSGDKQTVVDQVAKLLGIDDAFGGLLPDGKVDKVENLKKEGHKLAFVGDGVNDAPVIALADVGIAMGGLGSDATIETADVVIQNDKPSKIPVAIKVGKVTRNIVWQNIILAMTVKVVVLALGAGGVASLWEAVIADVGVALLAILNAVRIQQKKL
ncbi:heavy metal translocating P-type ATPase [Algoriphagus resistens]|uniref:heavy metal translocating P-type ATPase n=1 Tax=Algoriphagus resistens TaxID=1750590 RepID=UPI000AB61D47|nr:heavy metal translocating P-type ATPase [Algoriphagus resistens]